MFLTDQELVERIDWRRKPRRTPELSREEEGAAREVCAFLAATRPDRALTGRQGVAVVYQGAEPGGPS
jgi:hypothetical protein